MSVRSYIKATLITAIITLAIGGFLLHARVHPVTARAVNFVPLIAGILSVVAGACVFLLAGARDPFLSQG